MTCIPLSSAASGLLKSLLARVEQDRNRILLTEARSVDWQSLTFIGERHQLRFRIYGPDAGDLLERLTRGLEDAEFAVRGQTVASIAVDGPSRTEGDGSVILSIEALTIAD